MKIHKLLFCFLLLLPSTGLSWDYENILGPWLNLKYGGQAVGPAQTVKKKNPDGSSTPWYGSLQNGTLLPIAGEAFVRMNAAETSWGTGMIVSLLTRATAYYAKTYSPGLKFYIGSLAQQNGGPYGPHKSHQNGLDADVLFVGQTSYESVLDSEGKVTAKFDPQKNWDFWRLLVHQRLLEKGQPTSAVYMILVAPPIKEYLCQWAKTKNLLTDPLNKELLRRLRPTVGHDTHFHIRLKCSPYYLECYQPGDFAKDTGCP